MTPGREEKKRKKAGAVAIVFAVAEACDCDIERLFSLSVLTFALVMAVTVGNKSI